MRRTRKLVAGVAACILSLLANLAYAQDAKRPVSAGSGARTSAQGQAILVGELLRADAQAAVQAMQRAPLLPGGTGPVSGGPTTPATPAPRKLTASEIAARTPPLNVSVRSIYGAGDKLRATLLVDGVAHTVSPGALVGDCKLTAIVNRCVRLEAARPAMPPQRCPLACWTGEGAMPPTVVQAQAALLPAGSPGVGPLPPPLPHMSR